MPTVRATAPDAPLRLSDTVEVVLHAAGPAPLRVQLPADLLDPASGALWQITPVGPPATTDTTWAQTFRLSPFVPGEKLTVQFNPVTVNDTVLSPDALTFRVETSLRNATAADARPVTGIEPLPPSPAAEPPVLLAGVSLVVALTFLLIAVLAVARRRKPEPLTPGERVRERIGTLQTDRLHGRFSPAGFVEQLSTAFREYLAGRFGLNAERTTTAELLSGAGELWDADTRAGVEQLLRECDAVKFAGRVPTDTECDTLADTAGRLVDGWETPK